MRGRGIGRPWVWGYPAAGLVTAISLSLAPGLPLGPGRWPLGGPFGAFTWAAWFVATSLAVALGLLGVAQALGPRRVRRAWFGPAPGPARVLAAAAGFALLSIGSFAAASRSDLIEAHPAVALALALAALAALRGLTRVVAAGGPGRSEPFRKSSEPELSSAADRRRVASIFRAGVRNPAAEELEEDDDPEETAAAEPRWARWARWAATAVTGLLALVVLAGLAVRWLGPGLGLELTAPRPAPIFWGESAFYDYDAARRASRDTAAYLKAPPEGSPEATRRGVLPAGTRLSVKGWLDGGVEVRVEFDPAGKLAGEWGYIRLDDLQE